MAETLISDVIVPETFVPYVIERSAERTELVESGVIDTDSDFARRAGEGGRGTNMPFWTDLSGNDQVLSDQVALTTKKIGSSQDFAAIHNRGDAWAVNDLAKYLAGDDPMGAIGELVADYWARKTQATLISTLTGIFAAANMSGLVHGIHQTNGAVGDEHTLNGVTFVDAKQLMGDAKGKLTTIVMHSAVEASLVKADLIDFLPDSEGKPTIKTFQGLRVIMDDGVPTATVDSKTVYTTYIFAQGAVALGVTDKDWPINGDGTWSVEFGRNALAGTDYMINRRRFILHPRGVKWLGGTVAGESPTNAELEIGTNWTRVFDVKNLRIVKITHNIA